MISRTHCRRQWQPAALCLAWAALFLTHSPALVQAQVRVDTGYNALAAQLGSAMPTGSGIAVTQVEASSAGLYRPSSTFAGTGVFTGKTFTFRSPLPSGASGHAILVGNNYYGNGIALAPGITTIDSYEAGDWLGINTDSNGNSLGQGILRYNTSNNPRVSLNGSRVVNHSWIYTGSSTMQAIELLTRNDWLIATDDLIQVAGTNNGSASINQALFTYGANTISVGLSNLNHGKGTPTALTPDSNGGHPVYGRQGLYQHPRPDLVVPQEATSWATPVVGSAVALLIQASKDNPSWSTVSYTSPRSSQTIRAADTSEVIRAALLTGADRMYYNTDGVRLLDYRATAGTQAANGLDTRVGAGQLNIRNSYNILAGGQHVGATSGTGTVIPDAGFDYDAAFGGDAGSNTTATYQFTGAWTGQNFTAALVWNANIDMDQVYPNVGNNPLMWTQSLETAANIFDFNLRLIDITNPGSPVNVAVSNSTQENTENIFTTLVAGHQYQLEVSTPHTNIQWDYGLAWNGISNQRWNGTAGNNTWNVASAATWQRGTNTAATFLDRDQVVFNDTAGETTVNIGSNVAPAIITVDNTAKNYVFAGTGSITGGTLIKQGTGSLTLNNSHTYSGDTLLRAGSIRAGVTNALSPNSAIDLSTGTILDLLGNTNTVKQLSGSGTVNATGAYLGIAANTSATFAGTLINPAALNKSLAGTQTFTGNLQWQATNVNVQSGTLQFALNGASTVSLTAGTNVTVQAGATLELAGTKSAFTNGIIRAPVVTNAANAMVSVTGTNQVIGALTGPTSFESPWGIALGTTTVTSGASLTATRIRQSGLTVGANANVSLAPSYGDKSVGLSVFSNTTGNSLSLAAGSDFNTTDNDLIVYYQAGQGAATLATIQQQILDGFLGTSGVAKISSSTGAVDQDKYLVAFDNSTLGLTDWEGISLTGNNQIIAKYTLFGDLNLDNEVNNLDYSVIDSNFGSGNSWLLGDANLDGVVDSLDYSVIDTHFGKSFPLQSYGAAASLSITAVPEPGTWVLGGLGLLGLTGLKLRRRA